MARLYIHPTLEKSIRSYCEMNNIDDVNAFANRCAMQGFNIVKFGLSPKDNVERENNGIKDIKKHASSSKKKEPPTEDEGEPENKGDNKRRDEFQEESQKEKKGVTVRKIRIIKKQ